MKKEFFGLLILFVANSLIFPQSSDSGILSGKVTDSVSKDGLPGVSVYLSGTKIGASSDKNGNYKIGKIPPGKYVVVVLMIGYAPIVKNVEITSSSNIQRNFSLEYKPIEMKAVIVVEHSDEYDAYFKEVLNFRELFKKFFLGQTDFSKECRIENIEEIVFDKKFEPFIKATCPNPIRVINNALGYRIECVLLSFVFNNRQEGVSCEFYPKFEELIPESEHQKVKWNENRKSAFRSSLRRFLLSQMQVNGPLSSYGYSVPKATSLYKNIPASSLADGKEKFAYIDSTSGLYYLKFKGFLFVNNFLNDEQSMVSLPFGTAYIGADGCPIDPTSIQVTGIFAKQGVANLLPVDNSYIEWEE
ncbi:hypothetical protein C0389_02995 [bacterium]|nr:hypothetical protein [bacterium]